MAEHNKSAGAGQAPPYEEAAPYHNAPPSQPAMHQDPSYPQRDPYGYPSPQQHTQSNVNAITPQQQPGIQHAAMSPPAHTEQKGSFYGAGQQQQGIPMQNAPNQQSQYAIATPLASLGEGAAPVDCPACRERHLTRTEYVSGNTAMAWAGLLCFCCCLGCIPFMMRSLKDVEHHCGKCGAMLATWHNSGRTVVHVHA